MDNTIKTLFENLSDEDKNIQYQALMKLFDITKEKVNWAYEVWD